MSKAVQTELWKIYWSGVDRTFANGKLSDNPYPKGSNKFIAWERGFKGYPGVDDEWDEIEFLQSQ